MPVECLRGAAFEDQGCSKDSTVRSHHRHQAQQLEDLSPSSWEDHCSGIRGGFLGSEGGGRSVLFDTRERESTTTRKTQTKRERKRGWGGKR